MEGRGQDQRRYTALNYLRSSIEGRKWLATRNLILTTDQAIIFKMYEMQAKKKNDSFFESKPNCQFTGPSFKRHVW